MNSLTDLADFLRNFLDDKTIELSEKDKDEIISHLASELLTVLEVKNRIENHDGKYVAVAMPDLNRPDLRAFFKRQTQIRHNMAQVIVLYPGRSA